MNKLSFVFGRKNYQLLFAGLGFLILGYILMSGGGSPDPSQFNADELFSPRRITLAPLIVILGYIIVGVAIMWKSKEDLTPVKPEVPSTNKKRKK
ncbi:MAG: DUF3098 domain-containing protein [Crocinitomicaceae bacterium]|nr:DUF3098 domain-containing protein [Crocinitomicaceae bacterium]